MDDDPSEGENKHSPPSWHDHQTGPTAPFMNSSPHSIVPHEPEPPEQLTNPGTASHGTTGQPNDNRASTLIMQWLTYAFWGWTVLILSALTVSVLERLIAGQDTSTFNDYAAAGLIVLLPISFICDTFYSKKEPDKKEGASSLIMVIHAVLFALFTIGSLLFAAWTIVSLITDSTDRSSQVAGLISALIISLLYAATFMRTLNPSHISWIPKVYRFAMLGIVALVAILGIIKPTLNSAANTPNPPSVCYGTNDGYSSDCAYPTPVDPNYTNNSSKNNFDSKGKLEPSVVGGTQCDIPVLADGSTTGQVAVSGGATCSNAEADIQSANGKGGGNYTANGYTCTSTKQGSNTQWSSYWNDNFYSYNCTSGSKQVAFNLQTTAQKDSASTVTN